MKAKFKDCDFTYNCEVSVLGKYMFLLLEEEPSIIVYDLEENKIRGYDPSVDCEDGYWVRPTLEEAEQIGVIWHE